MSAPNESEPQIVSACATEDLFCDVCVDLGIAAPTILAGDRYALFLVAGTPCGAACDDCWMRTLEEIEEEQATE